MIANKIISGLALAAALSACSSPSSRFYTLAATASVPTEGAAPAAYSVVVDQVTIPALVDRPQFVVHQGANRVTIDEYNRWAAPLAPSIARIVAENLVLLLGTPRVATGPLGPSFDPACRVAIDILRFDSLAGKAATLDALWVVRSAGRTLSGRTTLREPVSGGEGYDALAAAHSRAIARLSGDIATAIGAEAAR